MIVMRIFRGIHEHFPARASEWALSMMLLNLGLIRSASAFIQLYGIPL